MGIREMRREDAGAMVAACRDPESRRWLPLPDPYTEDSYFEWMAQSAQRAEAGTGLELRIVDAEDRPIGGIGLKELARDEGYAEVGYLLCPEARGRGAMVRALRLLRDWAVGEFGVKRMEALIHGDNVASQRVAQAAGFAATGEYRRCPRGDCSDPDHMVFAWPQDSAGAG